MAEYYFNKMSIIPYNNINVRNICERAAVIHSRKVNINNYYTAELKDNTRADTAASVAWQDPWLDWLAYMNNNVLDPYYGWHLNSEEFFRYIIDKYGSVPVAEQQIVYYRTAWPVGDVNITISDFANTLPGAWQKYFQPVYKDDDGTLLYYKQSRLDWRMNTNQVLQWNISMTNANTVFAVGNTVQVTNGGNVVGQAQVVDANTSVVTAQHTSGNTNSLQGLQDMFNTTITATISQTTILQQNIPLTEGVFWEPLSAYDMEDEQNTLKKFINVMDNGLAMDISATMTTLFRS